MISEGTESGKGRRRRMWISAHLPVILLAISLGWLLLPAPFARAEPADNEIRIGLVIDGPGAINDQIRELTHREILTLTRGEFDVRFPGDKELIGDWTLESARDHLHRLLEDPEVDLIIAWGVLASHAACCFSELPKPVIAPVIIDPALQGLPFQDGASGVKNLTYVALPDNLRHELGAFLDIVPFRKVALLMNEAILEAIPELPLRTRGQLDDLGLEFLYVPVGREADPILESLPKDVDAVHAWPLFQMAPGEFQRLVDGLVQRRLPTFSAIGGAELEAGMLASMTSEEFFPRLARRVALDVQRILLGEDAGSIPVAFGYRDRLSLNMATARAIGVSPRWEVLLEANLLHAEDPESRRLSLDEAVTRAVEANLDLAAERSAVAAGEQEIALARARLRPQLEAAVQGLTIDEDRAAASSGSQPERSATASLTLTQLLYSDGARAGVTVQGELQKSRTYGLEALRLDIALETAVTYLNLLRSRTLRQVQRNNLELTRSNLELARVRRSIGTANPSEVYRWESQIAADRRSLVDAGAQVQSSEVTLGRLLHWDLETAYLPAEVELDTPGLITSEERFQGYIETPRVFRVLRDFMVQEGLTAAPELQQLRAAIDAQRRTVLAARRAFFLPTVSAQLSLDESLAEGGAGTDSLPGFEAPTVNDTNWTLSLSASLPLFSGGQRRAERLQAEEDLRGLEAQWASAAERLEESIRGAMIATRASFTGIELSREASAAARKNLDLVSDAYARGAVSILDLLDAQNAALNAEQDSANAVYDFFIDLMQAQRAANRFDFFVSWQAREEWYRRLDLFFTEAGVERWGAARTETGEETNP